MSSGPPRSLLVVADDFGIGPNTTAGILHLAGRGVVTGSVLLVNSPYAPDAVTAWRRLGSRLDLGSHPNLTVDAPILPAGRVPSLVGRDGRFWPLGQFLRRWLLGRLDARQIEAEFAAQLQRFLDLVGRPPTLVNTHQHVGLFPPVGEALLTVLRAHRCVPYVRRVREPWRMLLNIRGARIKRGLLNQFGRRLGRRQAALGFPGNDWLAGITDPRWVRDPLFFSRWLQQVPGRVVELVCHPGYADPTLIGRDCNANDGLLQRRVDEQALLERPDFFDAIHRAGFRLLAPAEWLNARERHVHAA